jgi:hypothetical protein
MTDKGGQEKMKSQEDSERLLQAEEMACAKAWNGNNPHRCGNGWCEGYTTNHGSLVCEVCMEDREPAQVNGNVS